MKCSVCGHESVTIDPIEDLELEIDRVTTVSPIIIFPLESSI